MRARERVASFGALVLAGSSLVACSAGPSRARPPSRTPYFESKVAEEPPEPVVSPEFDAAIRDYRRGLEGLPSRGAEDVEIRKTLRLLALALERVPAPGDVDVTRTSAVVRGSRARGLTRAAPIRGTEDSLVAVSETFTALARGPYRSSPGLLSEVYAFDEAARRASGASTEGACRCAAVEALRRAEKVLLALRQAASRGEVGNEKLTSVAW